LPWSWRGRRRSLFVAQGIDVAEEGPAIVVAGPAAAAPVDPSHPTMTRVAPPRDSGPLIAPRRRSHFATAEARRGARRARVGARLQYPWAATLNRWTANVVLVGDDPRCWTRDELGDPRADHRLRPGPDHLACLAGKPRGPGSLALSGFNAALRREIPGGCVLVGRWTADDGDPVRVSCHSTLVRGGRSSAACCSAPGPRPRRSSSGRRGAIDG